MLLGMKKLLFLIITVLLTSLASQAADYLGHCHAIEDDVLQTSLNINGGDWAISHTAFEDSACETPYLNYEIKYSVKTNARHIDMSVKEVSYTVYSDEVSEALNMVGYCGFSDWQANEKRIVTGKICDEFRTPKENEILYSIFELKNEGSEVYLGRPTGKFNGKTIETRHQCLDPYTFFITEK